MNFIFLTYVNRSGSTYLANLLDSSPKILACPEGDALVTFFLEDPAGTFTFDEQTEVRLRNLFTDDPKLQWWGEVHLFLRGLERARNNLEAFFMILMNYKEQVKNDAEYILFKAERLIFLVKRIKAVEIPHHINFINIVRDPRAVYASQKRTIIPETQKLMSGNPVRTALYWNEHARKGIREFDRGNLHLLKYEDLILDFKTFLKELSGLLNIELSEIKPENGSLINRFPESHKRIHVNVQKPADPSRISEWENQLNKTEVLKIEFITSKILRRFGYKKKYKSFGKAFICFVILPVVVYYYARKISKKILFKLGLI
jgi:hypothetical protein